MILNIEHGLTTYQRHCENSTANMQNMCRNKRLYLQTENTPSKENVEPLVSNCRKHTLLTSDLEIQ